MNGETNKPAELEETARLAAAQAERLAKRSAEQAGQPQPAAPQPTAASQVKTVGHISITLLSNGQVSVDAPLDRPDMCFAAIQAIITALLQHTAQVASAQAVERHKKVPFMKRMFPGNRART